MEDKKPALVAWSSVCRPKNQGGLGVLNINAQNNALLLKNLHKFFNSHDIPWVKLVWEAYYSTGHLPGSQMVGYFWWKAHTALLDQLNVCLDAQLEMEHLHHFGLTSGALNACTFSCLTFSLLLKTSPLLFKSSWLLNTWRTFSISHFQPKPSRSSRSLTHFVKSSI